MNLSLDKYWTYLLIVFTTNTYLVSTCLQLSSWITPDAHFQVTNYSFTYNWLYSCLLVFVLSKISQLQAPDYPNVYLYQLFNILGGVGFALLGEVPFLKNIAITPGFWGHLDENAKITILLFAAVFLILGIRQGVTACRNRDFWTHFVPYLMFIVFYGITLFTLIVGQANSLIIHVHHAICASLISFWFTDWSKTIYYITHAVLMGVVVEGIDFYGIGELSLFLCKNRPDFSLQSAMNVTLVFGICSLIFIAGFQHCWKRKIKNDRIRRNYLTESFIQQDLTQHNERSPSVNNNNLLYRRDEV